MVMLNMSESLIELVKSNIEFVLFNIGESWSVVSKILPLYSECSFVATYLYVTCLLHTRHDSFNMK